MLEKEIIPQLINIHVITEQQQKMMDANPSYPLFTPAFDREGYSPAFFKRLWEEHRIAVLTYRKNMKEDDLRDEAEFKEMEVETRLGKTRMKLQEKDIVTGKCSMREVRRLSVDGHQTSIITTNKILTV
ncbi:MAG: hypothetical protein LBG96_01655, partial [Tannerella sp.]|nr:hypothetical protein [Tannerella sp.]